MLWIGLFDYVYMLGPVDITITGCPGGPVTVSGTLSGGNLQAHKH